MLKRLEGSILLIIIGEVLFWALSYFSNNDNSNFSEFTSGVLLGLSVGMKVIGIMILLFSIIKYRKNENKIDSIKDSKK